MSSLSISIGFISALDSWREIEESGSGPRRKIAFVVSSRTLSLTFGEQGIEIDSSLNTDHIDSILKVLSRQSN